MCVCVWLCVLVGTIVDFLKRDLFKVMLTLDHFVLSKEGSDVNVRSLTALAPREVSQR